MKPSDPRQRDRHSIRLPGYDYAQAGAYFVTLVTAGRECLFGEIIGGEMRLSLAGTIASREWQRSADIRREIEMDVFVVMPNHIHGIVWIIDQCAANGQADGIAGPAGPTGDTVDSANAVGATGPSPQPGRAPQHPLSTHPSPLHPSPLHPLSTHPSPLYPSPLHPLPTYPLPTHPLPPHPSPVHPLSPHPSPLRPSPQPDRGIPPGGPSPLPGAPGPRPRSLGAFVAGFKASATVAINESRQQPGAPVWQRNYFDHVIRDRRSLDRIRRYIVENPLRWADDWDNPLTRPPEQRRV